MKQDLNTEWSPEDMGGAMYLYDESTDIEAVVVVDPTGETEDFLWQVNFLMQDGMQQELNGGSAPTEAQAKNDAQVAWVTAVRGSLMRYGSKS